VDEQASGVVIRMTNAAVLRSAQLDVEEYVNGRRTTYYFTLVATAPIEFGNVILVVFPGAIVIPP
jgi:hypothetical protein